ncbi:hypothetical protein EPN29_10250 [bacterium]|nr:MAG: hypothetical protein EPN29_10250 [bacterium]
MTGRRGQSLIELALCAPILMLLALGAAATVRVADARAGLEAATQAAAAAAARAPDPSSAKIAAGQRFSSMTAAYPLHGATLRLSLAGFNRAHAVVATSSGYVDIAWAALVFLPSRVTLESTSAVQIESWRSHRGLP